MEKTALDLLMPYAPYIAALFGLCIGSFITMASYRLPREEDIVRKSSHCPACQHRLCIPDLFPVLSWLAQRGKCRYCGATISSRYPVIELLTALTFLGIVLQFGVHPFSFTLLGLAMGIIIMMVTDFEHYMIPDGVQIWLAFLAILHAWLLGLDWLPLFIGSVAGFIFGYILCVGYPKLRGIEGLGFGDVKFFAVAGLWLGWRDLIPFFVLSGALGVLLALVWRGLGRGKYFPFGPALGISLFVFVGFPEIPAYFWRMLQSALTGHALP